MPFLTAERAAVPTGQRAPRPGAETGHRRGRTAQTGGRLKTCKVKMPVLGSSHPLGVGLQDQLRAAPGDRIFAKQAVVQSERKERLGSRNNTKTLGRNSEATATATLFPGLAPPQALARRSEARIPGHRQGHAATGSWTRAAKASVTQLRGSDICYPKFVPRDLGIHTEEREPCWMQRPSP
ncbi:hypothetical protein HJG60_011766 [Phyllostomus discolor]|uniref:Uncharacterized protein n=1 Tax=Phyllostomus discolor TaxID=89673 RepID=A0A834DVW3_9CHIR|nr:hypothetical protein HJG60_011766 [Phyllostomus discolor]